jgi:hypothetical protein
MIVIRIELWPRGDEAAKRDLGIAHINNVGGTAEAGHYEATLFKSPEYAKTDGAWREGRVTNFPRRSGKFGPWDLLLLALLSALGQKRVESLLTVTREVSEVSARGWSRGHATYWDEEAGVWRFADDSSLEANWGGVERPCVKCALMPTPEGHDACLGTIPGAVAACCGHGVVPPSVMYPPDREPEALRRESAR